MKRNVLDRVRAIVVIASVVLGATGCSSTEQIASHWRAEKITVDGDKADWNAVPSYLGDKRFSFSLANDDEFMYVCVSTADKDVHRQIVLGGFTVWFDRYGGDEKKFGIRYPLGMQPGDQLPPLQRQPEQSSSPDEMMNLFVRSQGELEVLGPEESDTSRMLVSNAGEIQVKMKRSEDGQLVYEMRVPLKKSPVHPYAIAIADSTPIGVGFETGEIALNGPGGPPGESGPDMGGPPPGGMGGPPPGGMGGPPPSGRPEGGFGKSSKPIEVWVKVSLATLH